MSWSPLVPVPTELDPDRDAVNLANLRDTHSAQLDFLLSVLEETPERQCTSPELARQGWQLVSGTLAILAQHPIAGLTNEAERFEAMRDQFLILIRVDPWAG